MRCLQHDHPQSPPTAYRLINYNMKLQTDSNTVDCSIAIVMIRSFASICKHGPILAIKMLCSKIFGLHLHLHIFAWASPVLHEYEHIVYSSHSHCCVYMTHWYHEKIVLTFSCVLRGSGLCLLSI